MGIKIRFAEEAYPVISRGRHRLRLNMSTNISENDRNVSGTEEIELMMTNRRFSLDPGEVYSCHPPVKAAGDFSHCLPHVVFKRATLPWEYEGEKKSPGLALFVCAKDEGVREHTMKIGQVFSAADPFVFCSKRLKLSESDAEKPEDSCQVVDVPAELFADLRLSGDERRLLTHVREVKLDDKVTDQTVKEGVFSCLVSNRFPGDPGEERLSYKAYVVSLCEYDGVSIAKEAGYVRLICLYAWEFTTVKTAYDFRTVIKKLRPEALLCPVPAEVTDPELRSILRKGFLPVNHDLRDGSKTVSWYRGPWIPMDEILEEPQYRVFSDQYYYYDPGQGMMDASYACAWQLGRMIAMNHAAVAGELLSWRMQNYHEAARDVQCQQLRKRLPEQEKDSLKQSLADVCISMAKSALSEDEADQGELSADNIMRAQVNPKDQGDRQWLRVEREHDDFFADGDFRDFPPNVRQLLKEASLFYHVPYVYLIPGKKMLKEEQIAFFRVDHNWVLALLDGICSVGRNASIDYSHDTELIVSEYQRALAENQTVRQRLQGKAEKEPKGASTKEPGVVSGFLLHSVLVEDFRGLEFSAYGDLEGKELLTALRIETLGAHLLVGIFAGEVKRVEIAQPPEGLHFGFLTEDGTYKKTMRNLSDGVLTEKQIDLPLKAVSSGRIFDIEKAAKNIADSLGEKTISSDVVALQMIQNGQTGVFTMEKQERGRV